MLPEENRCLDLLGRIATDHVLVENLGDFLQSLALLTDLRSGLAQRFEDSRSCFSFGNELRLAAEVIWRLFAVMNHKASI